MMAQFDQFQNSNDRNNRIRMELVELVLSNIEIYTTLFSYLDLESLKRVRLVQNSWKRPGGLALDHKIQIRQSPSNPNFEQVFDFLSSHRLHHTLRLSLLNDSWIGDNSMEYWTEIKNSQPTTAGSQRLRHLMKCLIKFTRKVELIFNAHYKQSNNMDYAVPLLSTILHQSNILLLTELRLELTFLNDKDMDIFTLIKGAIGVKKLALDFVRATDEAIQNIPMDSALFLQRLKTFAFRFHYCKHTGQPNLKQKSYRHLLHVFHRVHFLDLVSWDHLHSDIQTQSFEDKYCAEEIKSLIQEDDGAFPCLRGLRIFRCDPLSTLNFPRPLTYLSAKHRAGEGDLDDLVELVSPHRETLEAVELRLGREPEETLPINTTLPSLPRLRWLGIIANVGRGSSPYTLAMADPLNLRHLFLNGKLSHIYPSLIGLVIVLPFPEREEFFNYIFPKWDTAGDPIRVRQLNYIGISFIGTCASRIIQRLHAMFPNLTTMKHFLPNEATTPGGTTSFCICEHRCRNMSSVVNTLRVSAFELRTTMLPSYQNLLRKFYSKLVFNITEEPFFG